MTIAKIVFLALEALLQFTYDTKNSRIENEYLSLAGTLINCSGGVTPWGTWISCEETMVRKNKFLIKDHGYNFEVTPHI